MKPFFNFTAGELSGAITITVIIFILTIFQFFLGNRVKNAPIPEKFLALAAQFESQQSSFGTGNGYERVYSEYEHQDSIKKYPKKDKKLEYELVKLNINQCDTFDIKGIPQFGSARAAKLVEYRDQMGGFHSLKQIQEVFILQSIELEFLEQYFFVNPKEIKKIKINSISYEDLKKHPYFDAYLSKQVLKYREKSGPIRNIEEFQKATNAYGTLVEKVKEYLEFE